LVIDDAQMIQKLIKSALEIMGIRRIEVASNGREALQSVQFKEQAGEPFNLIICDWNMPVMDGITFLETFRKNNQKAVFIMFTVRTTAKDFNDAKSKGADYFFMKPMDVSMLKIRLDAAIDAAFERRLAWKSKTVNSL